MSYLRTAILAFISFSIVSQVFAASRNGFEYIEAGAQGNDGYAVFKLEGMIAYPMAREIEDQLVQIPSDEKILIDLNSGGGSVDEGIKIIDIIKREINNGRNINTLVDQGAVCGSMCVPVFVQGVKRTAGSASAFMFHGARPFHSNIPNAERTKRLLNIFIDAGVSQEFLNDLGNQGVFSTPGEYWLSGRELDQAKAGIITRLLPAHRKFTPWTAPFDPQIRSR